MIWWLCQHGFWGSDPAEVCARAHIDPDGRMPMVIPPEAHESCGWFDVERSNIAELIEAIPGE